MEVCGGTGSSRGLGFLGCYTEMEVSLKRRSIDCYFLNGWRYGILSPICPLYFPPSRRRGCISRSDRTRGQSHDENVDDSVVFVSSLFGYTKGVVGRFSSPVRVVGPVHKFVSSFWVVENISCHFHTRAGARIFFARMTT
jgi:hypothetical protein